MEQNNEAKELRDLLLGQMKRISDPNNDLEKEVKRADALAKVGTVVVNSHKQEVDLLKISQRPEPAKGKTLKLTASKKQIGNG